MTRFAIFGDSYITRLEKFASRSMSMSGSCRFFGQSGMSTKRKFTEKFQQMLRFGPDVVFMVLGGNSIKDSCSIDEIFKEIQEMVETLLSSGVQTVFVASIVERGSFWASTGLTPAIFNKIRRSLNKKLRRYLGPDFIDLGKQLKYPRHYDADLIHPGVRQGGLRVLQLVIERCFQRY